MIDSDTFAAICTDVAMGVPIRDAIPKHGANNAAFYLALSLDANAERYARAKLIACQAWADETLTLADAEPPDVDTQFGSHKDPGWVQWKRLQIDTRKWHLSKLLPKVYGEKLEVAGSINANIIDRLAEGRKRAAESNGDD